VRARLAPICIAGIVLGIRFCVGQTIEGRVDLPRATQQPVMRERYQANGSPAPEVEPPVAVVYLEGSFVQPAAHREKRAEMEQKNINFSPGVLPVQVGTTVDFPNLDDTYHNVFSYSKTKRFDLGRYRRGDKAAAVLFDRPGVVNLHCEIHASMRGTILVLETPYFVKTDAHGLYHLGPMPAGHYLLKAWVNEDDVRVQPVEIRPGLRLHVDFPRK
jgi:plastocyanin